MLGCSVVRADFRQQSFAQSGHESYSRNRRLVRVLKLRASPSARRRARSYAVKLEAQPCRLRGLIPMAEHPDLKMRWHTASSSIASIHGRGEADCKTTHRAAAFSIQKILTCIASAAVTCLVTLARPKRRRSSREFSIHKENIRKGMATVLLLASASHVAQAQASASVAPAASASAVSTVGAPPAMPPFTPPDFDPQPICIVPCLSEPYVGHLCLIMGELCHLVGTAIRCLRLCLRAPVCSKAVLFHLSRGDLHRRSWTCNISVMF